MLVQQLAAKAKNRARYTGYHLKLQFTPNRKSIGYFPFSPNRGSAFVVKQSLDVLANRGFDIRLNDPSCQVLLFRNTESKEILDLATAAKKKGKKIVWYLAETRGALNELSAAERSITERCWALADVFVANSIGYKEHYNQRYWEGKDIIIEESYPNDYPVGLCKTHTSSSNPVAVWHGFAKNMVAFLYGAKAEVERKRQRLINGPVLGNLKQVLPIPIVTISQEFKTTSEDYMRYAGIKPDIIHPGYPQLFHELIKYDIGLGPFPIWHQSCIAKPINKLAMYMLVGLPVIGVGTPEYKRWLKHGETGFICNTDEEWIQAAEQLRDPDLRAKVGTAGRELVLENFSPDTIADKWQKLFQTML
jgi:hypothetical protein